MVLQLADFSVGDRVELSPEIGARIGGNRIGEVAAVGRKLVTVRMRSGALVSVTPDLLVRVAQDG